MKPENMYVALKLIALFAAPVLLSQEFGWHLGVGITLLVFFLKPPEM
jgi:hypothetical protein